MSETKTEEMVEVQVTQSFQLQRLIDLLVNVFEMGSSSWYNGIQQINYSDQYPKDFFEQFEKGTRAYEALKHGLGITVRVDNPEDDCRQISKIIDKEGMIRAINVMAVLHKKHFEDFINENDDADTSDVFGQLIVYNELIFG